MLFLFQPQACRGETASNIYIVNIRHPMWRIPIYILRVMVFHCLNTGESEPLGELYPCLGNERPSRAICIGIRRIGCFIFILYNMIAKKKSNFESTEVYRKKATWHIMNGALYSALVCTRQMGILTLFCQAMGASAEVYFHIFNEIYVDHRPLFHIFN
jgi:hypothetical protein